MSLHADALGVLRAWHAPDAEQESLRTAYVAHLQDHADGVRRSGFPAHLTAGALVLDESGHRVLLNLHRKAGRWFHFGGHLEEVDPTLAAAALRETLEESGLAQVELSAEPVHLSAHPVSFCDPRGEVTHLDVRYAARVPDGAAVEVSAESSAVAWFDIDDLPTAEPDMIALLLLARDAG